MVALLPPVREVVVVTVFGRQVAEVAEVGAEAEVTDAFSPGPAPAAM